MNVLLVPWPLAITPRAFRAVSDHDEKMPPDFGLFTYDSNGARPMISRIKKLVRNAENLVGRIDAIVFPELSLSLSEYLRIRFAFSRTLIIAGIGLAASNGNLGRNDVALGLGYSQTYLQSKHHRWRLEERQIEQYGLGCSLTEQKWWWEAIRMGERKCAFFSANAWLTLCVLICEDLARQDPVAELVRTVGPNLVIALLMDGPQIAERWSARYATVLAEDPRCSVLTMTSAGLVDLANSQLGRGPRSIGLWKDALSGSARQIILNEGAEAVVLSLTREMYKEWTADGRHDDGSTGYLRLMGTHQVRI